MDNRISFSKKKKVGKERLDKYYHLAKEQGFRSRAAFKLIQLNKKYNFLENANSVVDLCAAPGGWCQVARKFCPVAAEIYGVDLDPIKYLKGVTTIVGDICLSKTLKRMQVAMHQRKADVVIHDGAPNVGSNWLRDSYAQCELVLHSLRMACALLRPNGLFITKVFRSREYNALLWVCKQLFERVEVTKPAASRLASAECYIVCHNFLAPKTIDSKMFDPNFVFADNVQKGNLKYELAWRKGKKVRNRSGYEDGDIVLFKTNSVKEFIESERPIHFLMTYSVLEFDEASAPFFDHPETSEEIKKLCEDTKVLGRYDFRQLLKWRIKMRRYKDELAVEGMENGDQMEDVEEIEDTEETGPKITPQERQEKEDAEAMQDLAKLTKLSLQSKLAELRRKHKKEQKHRLKQAKRPEKGINMTEKRRDMYDTLEKNEDLFSIRDINSMEHLEALTNIENASAFMDELEPEDLDGENKVNPNSDEVTAMIMGDEDDDEESRRDRFIQYQLDQWYRRYQKGFSRTKLARLKELEEQEKQRRNKLYKESLRERQNEYGDISENPLIARFDDEPQENDGSRKMKTTQWFSQNQFSALADDDEQKGKIEEDFDHRPRRKKKLNDGTDYEMPNESSDESDIEMEDEEQYEPDEVDQELAENPHLRAETYALAKHCLSKKDRRAFIDSSYNRFAFHDLDNLPDWYQDEHRVHYKAEMPITKEEVMEQKRRLAELNSRPVKAALEAKFRAKRRMAKNYAGMLDRAKAITDSNELSEKEKATQLRSLQRAQKRGAKQPKKIYITPGSSFQKRQQNSVFRYVDRRLKADKRGVKRKRSER